MMRKMPNTHRQPPRPGHTLIELVTATIASGFLLAGLGSVMLIANQVANAPTASNDRVEASAAVSELANELRFATFLVSPSANALEFVVADRDADGASERIRYEWSGVAGAPLTRSFNGGTPIPVVECVEVFQLNLSTATATASYAPNVDSPESQLAGYAAVPSGNVFAVTTTEFISQRLNPASFSGIPGNATSWNATRVEFMAQKQGDGETLRVQLRSAGDPHYRPTSEVLGEATILEDFMSGGLSWRSLNFASPIRNLALHRPYCLVWRGTSGESGTSARLARDNTATTGTSESTDVGATWNHVSPQCLYYRIFGTYSSPGTPVEVTRSYVTRVGVVLQCGAAAHSRIDTSIPLLNRPELLSAYWRADFDSDPTSLDLTGDGTDDWTMAGGGGFNAGTLVGGMWLANGALETRPKNDFTNVTTVDARCRNTSVGGNGAELKIQVDRHVGSHAPLVVRVQRLPDGTQSLTLYGKSNDATEVKLTERKNLGSDFIRYRLTILPDDNLVNLAINGQDEGTYLYPTYAPSGDDRFLTFSANTSTAEYDYVELRVAE